jgi:hypothetical protein
MALSSFTGNIDDNDAHILFMRTKHVYREFFVRVAELRTHADCFAPARGK